MKKHYVTFLIALIIIIVLELFSFFMLRQTKSQSTLFYKTNEIRNNKQKNIKIHVVDPLLGWAYSKEELENQGYEFLHNSILLSTKKQDCDSIIKIYISGGSTSDLVFDKNNWPSKLLEKINKLNKCAKIYVAAVSGYNSGQEFLKSLRDINKINPLIHISYSGANETEYPSYTSYYENQLFKEVLLSSTKEQKILPNTMTWLGNLKSNPKKTSLYIDSLQDPVVFWRTNIDMMNALAEKSNYNFISILQPVFGYSGQIISDSTLRKERYYHLIKDYTNFYPKAKIKTLENNNYHDLTSIFHEEEENVFHDDCHLKHKYQIKIADYIYYNVLFDILYAPN